MGFSDVISYVVPNEMSSDVVKASVLTCCAVAGLYYANRILWKKTQKNVTFVGQCSMCEQFEEEDIENFKNIALAAREFKRLSFSPTSRKWSPEGFSPNSQKWSQEGTSSNSQKWSHEGTSPTSQKWTQDGTSPGNLPRSQSWSRTDPSSPLKVPRPQNGATWM